MQRSNYDRYSITSSALASSFCGAVSPSVCLRAVDGLVAEGALAEAVGATEMAIRKAVEWQAPERLPRAAIYWRSRRASVWITRLTASSARQD
jgi:hypothetical protein